MSEQRHDTLDGIRILNSLTADARRGLIAHCAWRDFKPRQHIMYQQEDSRTVFFLTAGKARAMIFAESGRQVTFRDIDAGEMFGELAAIDGRPQAATVEAVTKCTVANMSLETFWDLLRAEPAVMSDVLKRLTAQVRAVYEKVIELSTLPVRKRIQAELLRMAEPNVTALGDAVLFPAPTDGDVASRVAVTHVTVHRELGEMLEAGLIEKRGRRLVIPDVEKLRRLVAESD
jgi:CRP/FNR family transcriptional regulator, cyclic AMP receptor protein